MDKQKDTPLVFSLFGATGDLARKKVMPALYALYHRNRLPAAFTIIAFSRRPWTDDEYHSFITPSLEVHDYPEARLKGFLSHVVYVQGVFDDEQAYRALKKRIEDIESAFNAKSSMPAERIYHLAIQPEFYELVIAGLGAAGLNQTETGTDQPKLLIEKPIGSDLASAQELEMSMAAHFTEKQKYRVDHYLGKEGLQAIITERINNPNFDFRLSNQYVERIDIRIWEIEGIADRGEFYDATGALRDVGQNHALEMLAVTAMDIPKRISAETLSRARALILKALKPLDRHTIKKSFQRAQYEGSKHEEGFDPQSKTETYFKLKTEIVSPRWQGVPVIIEAGKYLPEKLADVAISFKDGTDRVFDIQRPVSTDRPDAYEIIIEKAIRGDKSVFVSDEEVIASWKFITSILENMDSVPLQVYKNDKDGHRGLHFKDFDYLDPRYQR